MRRAVATALALASLLAADVALADHHLRGRIAVIDGPGRAGRGATSDVRTLVPHGWEVVSPKTYQKWARRLDARGHDPDAIVAVAERLELSAVVVGTLHAAGNGYDLELRVYDGKHGAPVSALTVRLDDRRIDARGRELTHAWLAAALDAAAGDGADPTEESDWDEDAAADDDRPVAIVEDRPRTTRAERTRSLPDEPDELDDRDGAPAATAPRRAGARLPLELAVGASVVNRTLTFVARPDMADAPQPLAWSATGVYARAEWFPWLGDAGALARLGVGCTGELSLTASVDGEAMPADAVSQATAAVEQRRWGAYLRYLLWTTDSVTVEATAGYNRLTFAIDRNATQSAALAATPQIDYTYFDPGLAVRVPLSGSLTLAASAHAVLPIAAGEITQAEQYGAATATGASAEAAVVVDLGGGFHAVAGAGYRVIGLDFDGTGARAAGTAGATEDVGGADDTSFTGFATVGYRR